MPEDRIYLAIDLKSFYASVECIERGLDPLNTNLVVADESRTDKTICLAVSPSLKSYGIPGRARLFEVIRKVSDINDERRNRAPGHMLKGRSFIDKALKYDPSLELDYIIAKPQMARYMEVSAKIYSIYLKYVAPEDIYPYSIDEVFIDATSYLKTLDMSAHDFTRMLIREVLYTTGITATAGIGTNMYLSKIAMDIVAKHIPPDIDGVRIASLNEREYKEQLWDHRPLTDFWRVGGGIAARLEKIGIRTMGDIAFFSTDRKRIGVLYDLLGKNAELLIDHAWGIEPTTMADVKNYRPKINSISSGQVLQAPTDHEHTKLIVWEMADMLSMDLLEKGLVTDQLVLTIGYDRSSIGRDYQGEVAMDRYGRKIPKHAHGTINLKSHTSSTKLITDAAMELFNRIADKTLYSRRLNITAGNVIREDQIPQSGTREQLSLFDMIDGDREEDTELKKKLEKERAIQKAVLEIKHKYGKNAVLKAKNLSEGATAKDRNGQIGGHKA